MLYKKIKRHFSIYGTQYLKKNYKIGFLFTGLLSIGGFMMMPFGSAFAINKLKITRHQLPILFMITGIATLITMPLIGRLSDTINKFKTFAFATFITIIGIMSRMAPSAALTSTLPNLEDSDAFMSINSSLQQMAGGFGDMFAGMIIVQKDNYAPLENYNILGMIASLIMLITIYLMYRVNKIIEEKQSIIKP